MLKKLLFSLAFIVGFVINTQAQAANTPYWYESFSASQGCDLPTVSPTTFVSSYFNTNNGSWYGGGIYRTTGTGCPAGNEHIRARNIVGSLDSQFIITPVVANGIQELHFKRARANRSYSIAITDDTSATTTNWTQVYMMISSATTVVCDDTMITINSATAKRLRIRFRRGVDDDIDSLWMTRFSVGACVTTTSIIYDTICSGTPYTFNGQMLSASGTYLDTLVNAGGCDSIITLNLTINPLPVIRSATATPSNICTGDSSLLKAKNALGGDIWVTTPISYNMNGLFNSPSGLISCLKIMISDTITTNGLWLENAGFNASSLTNMALYSDSANYPKTKIVECTQQNNMPLGRVLFPISDMVLSPGNYWVAFNTNGPSYMNFRTSMGSSVRMRFYSQTYSSGFPASLTTNTYFSTTGTASGQGVQIKPPTPATSFVWSSATTLVNATADSTLAFPTTTTNYTVTASSALGCTATSSVSLTVNQKPVIGSVSATPSTICSGDSSLLKVTNALASDVWVTTPITYNLSGGFNQANLLSCIKITIPTTSTIDGLWLDNDGMTASTFANLVLYSDSASFPKTKIVEGVAQTNMPLGRVFFPISDIVLSPGDYWVGVNSSEFLYSRYSIGMGTSVKLVAYNQLFSAGFPSTISASTILTTGVANGQGVQIKAPTPATSFVWSSATTLVNATADSTLAFPTTTTNYTVTASSALGCTATSSVTVTNNSTGGLAQATSNNTASISGNTNQTFTQNDGITHTYADANCNVISTINDGAGGNVLGSTVSTVIVDASVQTYNTQPYVRRHYTITPTNQGAATVTLYLTQADFDDYNANNGTYLDLPTGPSDATGIANVRITKVNGVLGVAAAEVITPTIAWDAVNMYWTATFSVSSFSSFYFHTVNPNNSALPITLLSFTGIKEAKVNVLNWITSMEQNNSYFTVERSSNAREFEIIGKINTKAINGNSSSLLKYELQDENPKVGHNYYRLQQVDIDGKSTLSQVIDLYRDAYGNVVNVYPNPTSSKLNIELTSNIGLLTAIKLSDLSGRIIKEITTTNNISQIDMSNVAIGIYLLQVEQDNQIISTQKVEKK